VTEQNQRAVSLQSGDLHVKVNLNLGCEMTYLGTENHNVLASYDWTAPVPASSSTSYGDNVMDWLSEYRGGWQTLLPNAGDPCTVGGVPLPFHGEWSRAKVITESQDEQSITVSSGLRLPLVARRSISLHPTNRTVTITQSIRNVGRSATPFIWGEHPAFALSAGARIHIPAGQVHSAATSVGTHQDILVGAVGSWPMMPGTNDTDVDLSIVPAAATSRLCYLPEIRAGWAVLQDEDVSVALSWDVDAFPHIWLWQEIGNEGFPSFGRSAITAVEPQSTWPAHGLAAAMDAGQARWLEPGESAEAWMSVAIVDTLAGIPQAVDKSGKITYKEVRD